MSASTSACRGPVRADAGGVWHPTRAGRNVHRAAQADGRAGVVHGGSRLDQAARARALAAAARAACWLAALMSRRAPGRGTPRGGRYHPTSSPWLILAWGASRAAEGEGPGAAGRRDPWRNPTSTIFTVAPKTPASCLCTTVQDVGKPTSSERSPASLPSVPDGAKRRREACPSAVSGYRMQVPNRTRFCRHGCAIRGSDDVNGASPRTPWSTPAYEFGRSTVPRAVIVNVPSRRFPHRHLRAVQRPDSYRYR